MWLEKHLIWIWFHMTVQTVRVQLGRLPRTERKNKKNSVQRHLCLPKFFSHCWFRFRFLWRRHGSGPDDQPTYFSCWRLSESVRRPHISRKARPALALCLVLFFNVTIDGWPIPCLRMVSLEFFRLLHRRISGNSPHPFKTLYGIWICRAVGACGKITQEDWLTIWTPHRFTDFHIQLQVYYFQGNYIQ